MESSFNVSRNRHVAFFETLDIDKILAQEDEIIDDIHTTVEQNGVEVSEEELLWEHFRKSKEG